MNKQLQTRNTEKSKILDDIQSVTDSQVCNSEAVSVNQPLKSPNAKVILKGSLVKRNWYNNKQLRLFHLYDSGEVQYFAEIQDKQIEKGGFLLTPTTRIELVDAINMRVHCDEKKRTYFLMQPHSSKVNFREQEKLGRNCNIKEWAAQMQKIISDLSKGLQGDK